MRSRLDRKCFLPGALLGLLLMLVSTTASAVRIGEDGRGQVLLFPIFAAGPDHQSTLEIRNTESEFAKAVRVVFKDPINARPTLAVNVYLNPGDSWTATVAEGTPAGVRPRYGVLLPWSDASCTFPRADSVPEEGLPLSDSEFGESFGDVALPDRLIGGSVEVYEMGRLIPEIAGDCAAVYRRFVAMTGAWYDDDSSALRNRGIRPPSGGLQGSLVIFDESQGIGYPFEALALDEFSAEAFHTHPDNARSPNLADVNPAVSVVWEEQLVNGERRKVERISDWAEPIHAVDALLMTEQVRADYVSIASEQVLSYAVLGMPTAAYHNDAEGYYLANGTARVAAPFPESAALGSDLDTVGAPFEAQTLNGEGETFELHPPGGNTQCDELRGPTTTVTLTNIIAFTHPCDVGDAELRIPGNATRGELTLRFAGELVSQQGDVYRGLPLRGFMLQAYRNRGQRLPGGVIRSFALGWSQPMKHSGGLQSD